MKENFYIEGKHLEETKKVIRSLDSLRFERNPFKMSSGKYNLNISGNVKDMNKLNDYLEKHNIE